MTLKIECRECSQMVTVQAKEEDVLRWVQGELIQKALPYLSEDDREMLITRTCSECWKKMFEDAAN
jgi:DNA-directed RNA polymerase subunit RPC12/RpoP